MFPDGSSYVELQIEVDAVKKYSDERKMLLNPIKTKTMIFNTLKNHDVLPIIHTDEGKELEVVEEAARDVLALTRHRQLYGLKLVNLCPDRRDYPAVEVALVRIFGDPHFVKTPRQNRRIRLFVCNNK